MEFAMELDYATNKLGNDIDVPRKMTPQNNTS